MIRRTSSLSSRDLLHFAKRNESHTDYQLPRSLIPYTCSVLPRPEASPLLRDLPAICFNEGHVKFADSRSTVAKKLLHFLNVDSPDAERSALIEKPNDTVPAFSMRNNFMAQIQAKISLRWAGKLALPRNSCSGVHQIGIKCSIALQGDYPSYCVC
jgi:hypothetical protein